MDETISIITNQFTPEQTERYTHFLSITNNVILECDIPMNTITTIVGKSFLADFIPENQHFTDFINDFKSCVYPDDQRAFNVTFAGYLSFKEQPQTIELEHRIVNHTQNVIWVHTLMTPFYKNNLLDKIIICINNIDKAKKAESEISFRAEHDGMTGLLNKVSIEKCIDNTLKDSLPDDSHILIMLDLDNFKTINDAISHEFGDKALINCAKTLKTVMGTSAVIGRYGGDEFLLLLKNRFPDPDFFEKLKELSSMLNVTYEHKGQSYPVSASIGIALYPKNGKTGKELQNNADCAMYYVKNNGRNNYALFHEHMPKHKTANRLSSTKDYRNYNENLLAKLINRVNFDRYKKWYLLFAACFALSLLFFMIGNVSTAFKTNHDGYVKNLYGKSRMALSNSMHLFDDYGKAAVKLRRDPLLIEWSEGAASGNLSPARQNELEKQVAAKLQNTIGHRQSTTFEQIYVQGNTGLPANHTLIKNNVDLARIPAQSYKLTFYKKNEESRCIVSSPIHNDEQTVIGYLHIIFNKQPFRLASGSENEFIMFVDTDNRSLIYLNDATANVPMPTNNVEIPDAIYANLEKKNNFFLLRLPNNNHLLASVYAEPNNPIAVVCGMDYNTLNFAVTQTLSIFLLLLFFLFIIYRLYDRTNEAINNIVKQCSLMALGDDTAFIPTQRDKTLNVLAQTINTYHHQVKIAAYIDSLLQIGNRFKCYRDIDYLLTIKPNEYFSLFMWDIVGFSNYNTIYSTNFGDKLLIMATDILKNVFGQRVYRINGDVLVGLSRHSDASESEILKKLAKKFSAPLLIDNIEININYRVGISRYPAHGTNAGELLKKAQMAINHVKTQSNITATTFNHDIENTLREEQQIRDLIKKRIADQSLEVWYQPIYDVKNGAFPLAEALLRLRDETGQIISPIKVIAIAEKFNMINMIDDYVLHHCCAFIKKATAHHLPLKNIQINLSVQELLQSNYVEKIENIIASYQINPCRIGMEITETVLIESFERVIPTIKKLQELGIKIALDDFGSGYSSLTYLSLLPINSLKLDRKLVANIDTDKKAAQFIGAIINLAKIKNLTIIAEGIETLDVANILLRSNCDYIQGYYYSKPLPESDFFTFLEKTAKNSPAFPTH